MAVNGVKADQVTGMNKNPDWKFRYNIYNPDNIPKYIELGNAGVEAFEMANPTAYNAAKAALKAEHPVKGWVADHLLGY